MDSQTLIVTTPELNKEDFLDVTVINPPDTGISDGDITVTYSQPVPSDPVGGLKVELVADRYIKLYGYEAEDVEYYEIFFNISDESIFKLSKKMLMVSLCT